MGNYVKPKLEFVNLTAEERYAAGSRINECVPGVVQDHNAVVLSRSYCEPINIITLCC